jgi:hypothetical protein
MGVDEYPYRSPDEKRVTVVIEAEKVNHVAQ